MTTSLLCQRASSITKLFPLLASVLLSGFLFSCSDSTPSVDTPPIGSPDVEVTYTASAVDFINPERGFYKHESYVPTDDKVLSVDKIKTYREQNISQIFMMIKLRQFVNQPISDAFLNKIRQNLTNLREGGSKTILRFSYSNDRTNENDPYDAPLPIVKQHLSQLKPIFEEYKDVIVALEAGFVGAYGEWYYSTYYGSKNTDADYAKRKEVLLAILDALPTDRMICLRTPLLKSYTLGLPLSDSIQLSTAFNGSPQSRIGGHNDCFLKNETDAGTFKQADNSDRLYWQTESRYTPMGGETCGVSEYNDCEPTIEAMRNYHWSYLNLDYDKNVIQKWKDNGCFDQISKSLGYRFELTKGSFSSNVKAGTKFTFSLDLKNVGFASPYNPRPIEVVLVSSADPSLKYHFALNDDVRYWFPNQNINIKGSIDLPNDLQAGSYTLYLNLPDASTNLKTNPNFSIRLANENMWQAETGYNKIYELSIP